MLHSVAWLKLGLQSRTPKQFTGKHLSDNVLYKPYEQNRNDGTILLQWGSEVELEA